MRFRRLTATFAAFCPVRPVESPTAIDTGARALIAAADGDGATPYPEQLAMHRTLKNSRMVTSSGRFAHGQHLSAGNPCIDGTVNRYLVEGVLPTRDTTCVVGE